MTKKLRIIEKFWNALEEMHLYKTKAESTVKGIAFGISWIGGVYTTDKINDTLAVNLYLFSIALLIETLIPLICESRFIKKINLVLIVIPSIIVFIAATAKLVGKPFGFVSWYFLYNLTLFCVGVIAIDALIQLIIESPKSIETKLKNI